MITYSLKRLDLSKSEPECRIDISELQKNTTSVLDIYIKSVIPIFNGL